MKAALKLVLTATILTLVVVACASGAVVRQPAVGPYLVTNDDVFNTSTPSNTATIYKIGAGGSLKLVKTIPTHGGGVGGGFFGTPRVDVLHSKTQPCAFVGDANYATYGNNAPDVAAINLKTLALAGNFRGNSTRDSAENAGVGLADAGAYVIASFSGYGTVIPATLATYKLLSDCKLKYQGSVRASGITLGSYVNGMKATPDGKTLVVTYGDGSIGTYSISATGKLTLIGQETTSTGAFPAGVDITADSKWAIFGDASFPEPSVDIAPIKAGKLGPTVHYTDVDKGLNSNNVMLSPDETVLYVSNNYDGAIGAVPFNKTNGKLDVAHSCSSNILNGFDLTWFYVSALAFSSTTGTGGVVYGAEFGFPSGIAQVQYSKTTGGDCELTELPSSPVSDAASNALISIESYPPRPF